ncbi:MAG TPA: hypothetical protein VMB47_08415, partial [Candidatus Aquilonibacter sp.]|nr:hypothetical protein [Candidatus Aquilonibacter sp.]
MKRANVGVVSIGVARVSAALALATLLFVSSLAEPSVRAQTATRKGALNEAQILALQKKFQDASMAADLPALSALMADNAIFIH